MFNDQASFSPSNPQSKWNKVNFFAFSGTIATLGTLGALAGGVYGLVRGNPNAKEDALIARSKLHAEPQKPEQEALDSDEPTPPHHTATIQPRETSQTAAIAAERSAEKPAEMAR